ncbi:hypothetical protein [Desulfonatronovibrio magnus]|uniref:hypothetical protein n=1 Tax=Desulfonatronovibrio magnus TaxID=698827 RepID=UPI0012F8D949|nr:hypothetical protein [Desulfonatronovibrio magnus]
MTEVEISNPETEELRDLRDEDYGAITALARISFPVSQSSRSVWLPGFTEMMEQ